MRCHRNSLVSVLAAAGVKCSVPCHCGPGAALLRCNTVYAVPTIDDRLASEGNGGPDLNSRRTISHSRFDGFVPIVEQSCWCQTTAAGNSWRRCLKLNGPNQISDVPIEFLIYRKHRCCELKSLLCRPRRTRSLRTIAPDGMASREALYWCGSRRAPARDPRSRT
jgi:hypothetical protein